jgi:hypothetical protein
MSNPLDYVLLGRSLPDTILTIDVLVDSLCPQAWVVHTTDLLCETPGVVLRQVLVIGSDPDSGRCHAKLFTAYHRLSVQACKPFKPMTFDALCGLGVEPTQCASTWQALLKSDPPDILLCLIGRARLEDCDGLARKHVWSLILGDPEQGFSAIPYFHEMAGHGGTLSICLVQHSTRLDRGCIWNRLQFRNYRGFYYLRAAEEAVHSIGSVIARRLHDVLLGTIAVQNHLPNQEIDLRPSRNKPSTTELTRYLFARVWEALLTRTLRLARKREWFVAWRDRPSTFTANRESFMSEGFKDYVGRSGFGYADPFPFEKGERQFIFMEEISPTGHGRLVVSEIVAGRMSKAPTVIVEKPYHMSYPFVFDSEGEIYIIPETCQNCTVELYRAVRFPDEWTLQRVLVSGLRFVDTTPFFYEGLWYFFVTTADYESVARESHLYYSDRLEGAWTSHPANPISSDVRRMRSAGRLFWRNGRLLRPVQDCSLDYGLAVRLMEVKTLTPEKYVEEEVEVIDAGWHPQAICTHTLNSSGGLEVIDGERWRLGR